MNPWTKEEFICFLLIYISNVDIEFTEGEKNKILEYTSAETYQKMNDIYNRLNDYQVINKILEHKELYCNTSTDRQEVFDIISEQLKVDGVNHPFEEEIFLMLKKIM